MNTYAAGYAGYVYIWYDTLAKFYYVGGHYGRVEDSYICSSKSMKRAYKLRPHTFKFRVLEYVYGDTAILRLAEQRWLDMIKDSELMISENVLNATCRYYNVKKTSSGGNGSANKGKSHPAWNKGLKGLSSNKGLSFNKGKLYKRKPRITRKCIVCTNTWEALPSSKKKYCSTVCSPKKGGGWNIGQKLEYCDKLSQAKLGRKRVYRNDGTWFMS